MNTYRTSSGLMVAKLKPGVVQEILTQCDGTIKTKVGKTFKGNVFVFSHDQTLDNRSIGRLYFWKDSYIELG